MNLTEFSRRYGAKDGVNQYYVLGTIILLSSVFVYGYIRCLFNFNDIFSNKMNQYIDGWVMVHFSIYVVIGLLFPGTFYLSMTIGILWEIFELWAGYAKPSFLIGIGNCRHDITNNAQKKMLVSNDNKGKDKYWWYGQYEDIIADLLGFIVGKYILIPILL